MYKKFIYFFCINFLLAFNINSASNDDWKILSQSIDQFKVELIKNYIDTNGTIETIYDLIEIEGININDINQLKGYVSVAPIGLENSFTKRSSYKLERWLSSSENQEGLSENWLDLFFNPMNVNNMNYDDLYSLPNLSPIDVTGCTFTERKRIH